MYLNTLTKVVLFLVKIVLNLAQNVSPSSDEMQAMSNIINEHGEVEAEQFRY